MTDVLSGRRFYIQQRDEWVPRGIILPVPSTDWEDTTGYISRLTDVRPWGVSLGTPSFADANAANRDCLLAQLVTHSTLRPNQRIAGAQALKFQCLCSETNAGNNLFLALGIRVISKTGAVQKVVLAVTRDGTEIVATTLTNRQFTATSAAGDYFTQEGDRILFEVGAGGDPGVGLTHSYSLRLGDATYDLPEDDTATADGRPWIEFAQPIYLQGPYRPRIWRKYHIPTAAAAFVTPAIFTRTNHVVGCGVT